MNGKVVLVGAGPGDPGLITMRGVEWLRRADAVLYDYLVNPEILRHTNETCDLIFLGQHGRASIWPQSRINDRLVTLAKQGKIVVRLKSGDPMVFGRAADELDAILKSDIPFEIVPGITAALAAGSSAGIPITHRDHASSVALITGQEGKGKSTTALDFDALARFPGTLVVYMGVTTAKSWTESLIAAGKPGNTPTALIRRCSWPNQQTIHCRLDEVIANLTPYKKFPPPVIAIIGNVTELAERLSWFQYRRLFGKRILVTRPRHQADALVTLLAEQGADAICYPAIQIEDPHDWDSVDTMIGRLAGFEWLVFSSANGVERFIGRIFELGEDARTLAGTKLASIGPATSAKLLEYGLRADLEASEYRAESLANDLSPHVRNAKVLLARASRGREVLSQMLTEAGATVEQVVVYQSEDTAVPDYKIMNDLAAGKIDWVTVTSSATARSLHRLFGESLNSSKIASISPITSNVLRQLGIEPSAEASVYTMPGLVDAICRSESS